MTVTPNTLPLPVFLLFFRFDFKVSVYCFMYLWYVCIFIFKKPLKTYAVSLNWVVFIWTSRRSFPTRTNCRFVKEPSLEGQSEQNQVITPAASHSFCVNALYWIYINLSIKQFYSSSRDTCPTLPWSTVNTYDQYYPTSRSTLLRRRSTYHGILHVEA